MIDSRYDGIVREVEGQLSCSAHSLDHVYRVYHLCEEIAKTEDAVNLDVLLPAALLHDIARVIEDEDETRQTDHAVLGAEMARDVLKKLDYDVDLIDEISYCVRTHRLRSGEVPETIEAKILFDADKLDCIGAVGIARVLMLGGKHGQSLTMVEPVEGNTIENGRIKDLDKHSPIIEYELKLKKIHSKLFTDRAKEIGLKRSKYMDEYFELLKSELNNNF